MQFHMRICKIEIVNFKNTEYGCIKFPNEQGIKQKQFIEQADLIGLYGQNGSGKTTIIEAVDIIRELLLGNSLPRDMKDFIMLGKQQGEILCEFYLEDSQQRILITYHVVIAREDDQCKIISETLKASVQNDYKWSAQSTIIGYDINKNYFPNHKLSKFLKKSFESMIEIRTIAKREQKSYVFSEALCELLKQNKELLFSAYVIDSLMYFAAMRMVVITSRASGSIQSNDAMYLYTVLHFDEFDTDRRKGLLTGIMGLPMNWDTKFSKKQLLTAKNIVNQLNIVLPTIVQGLSLKLIQYGEVLDDYGDEAYRCELVSCKNGNIIPLRMESDGCKKIISILSSLIAMFTDDSIFVAIDELDSGIFEYLLGELLEVLQENGKGQLLFTSHNLIVLEKLKKESIYFSTTDPKERFIHMQNVKPNHNLRDLYLRTIELGGQKKELYEYTSKIKMIRAFKKAGKIHYEQEL